MLYYHRNCDNCQHSLTIYDNTCPNCGVRYDPLFKNATAKSPDLNVEKNRQMLLDRSLLGVEKYGFTTDTNPLTLRQWLQHALEEALDQANYLQAAISLIDKEGK